MVDATNLILCYKQLLVEVISINGFLQQTGQQPTQPGLSRRRRGWQALGLQLG